MTQQTIYALSTAYGRSGVSVIRISGDDALSAVKEMTDIQRSGIKARYAYFSKIYHAKSHKVLDSAIVLYFKGPHSFTGEDVVEIQCHGSKAVLRSVFDSLSCLDNFRLAEPGEFSKRAFYNQKMDLTEAEGLEDLINAETEEQQKQALAQISGNLKNLYTAWREKLLDIYARLEAYIDFPEEDIPFEFSDTLLRTVGDLRAEMNKHMIASKSGERLREGFRVVITGPTNAGKSSLMNSLVLRQAAIVSDIAGTTRDALDAYLDISGYPVIITDTAGLRQSSDEIEKQGIQIAYQKMNEADIILAVFDATKDKKNIFDTLNLKNKDKVIYIANKSDLTDSKTIKTLKHEGCLPISAKTKEGIQELSELIKARIEDDLGGMRNFLMTRARHFEALKECMEELSRFSFDKPIELSAEDIRLAARALGKITGAVEVEEVLEKIFSTFCIGK